MCKATVLSMAVLAHLVCSTTSAEDARAALDACRKLCVSSSGALDAVMERRPTDWRIAAVRICSGTDYGMELCSTFASLNSLYIASGSRVTGNGLRKLGFLPNLKRLTAEELASDRDAQVIGTLANLEELDLGSPLENALTDNGLLHLSRLQKIRRLDLFGLKLTDVSLACIKRFTRLEELDLQPERITDTGFSELSGLERVASLKIGYLGSKGVSVLQKLPHLEHLGVVTYVSTRAAADLSVLKGLKWLELGNARAVDGGAIQVRLPENLLRLDADFETMANLDLRSCKHLANIQLDLWKTPNERGHAANLQWLASCSELRSLGLTGAVSDNVAVVAGLTSLRELAIQNNCITPFADGDMRLLGGLRQLESLRIDIARLTAEGTSVLRKFPNLRRLGLLRLEDLDAAALASVWEIKDLRALDLDLSDVPRPEDVPEILTRMRALTRLEELSLCGTLTDAALENVAALNSLRRLDLTKADGYTDAGLAALMSKSRSLQIVEVTLWPPKH